MELLYKAAAISTGNGRDGHVKSSNGVLDIDVRIPSAMGGKGGDFTNPEELFAAGYSACFHSALNMALRNAHKKVDGTVVKVTVGIGKDDGGFRLTAWIEAAVPGVSQSEAHEFVELAHTICPYSKAIKGNVTVELSAKNEADFSK